MNASTIEYALIALAYGFGALAVIIVPLPAAGPYQRLVASLDSLGLGLVVATMTFWIASGSKLDSGGQSIWAIADAAIMAMIGYVAVRRSQRDGIDWSLFWLLAGVGGYLGGILITTTSNVAYHLGHPADASYFLGMACFAVAPLVERRTATSNSILKPVRWGHVLAPYILVGVLTVILIFYQVDSWSGDPTGAVIVLGILATMLVVLLRQLAMIAEQRRKIEIEQQGVIATVSHELRTPLTTVVGFLDLLEEWDSFTESEKIEMVTLMRGQGHVMARVVGDLVAVARQEMERLETQTDVFAVDDMIASALSVVPELDESSVTSDIAPGMLLVADRDRMIQVVTNYLSNAAKYGAGSVEIVAFAAAGDVVIEVHDDGPGVPDVFELVIWERFERGMQRQGAIPGSGIGLSVAQGIARSHGGDTHYRRSERLGGSCFGVRIPPGNHPDVIQARPA